MLMGQTQASRLVTPGRLRRAGSTQASVLTTSSDSMVKDRWLAHPPNWFESRQTKQPGPRSAKIPCFLVPVHFPFWIQALAAASRNCRQEFKTVYTWSEQVEGRMATSSLFSASLIDSAFYFMRQNQGVVSMSSFEVEKCR
jgi:hypothetical protein